MGKERCTSELLRGCKSKTGDDTVTVEQGAFGEITTPVTGGGNLLQATLADTGINIQPVGSKQRLSSVAPSGED